MRLVLMDFMSLDGVAQAPGGADEDTDGAFVHGGWSHPYFDPEGMGTMIATVTDAATALLFGRRTYDSMAASWPGRAGDPFADRMNAIPKYVVSRTYGDGDVTWNNTTLLTGDTVDAVRALLAAHDGDMLMWGSTELAQQMFTAGLVDEFVVFLEPILLGGGKRLFPLDGQARPLRLISAEPVSTGTIMCRYAPDAPKT